MSIKIETKIRTLEELAKQNKGIVFKYKTDLFRYIKTDIKRTRRCICYNFNTNKFQYIPLYKLVEPVHAILSYKKVNPKEVKK